MHTRSAGRQRHIKAIVHKDRRAASSLHASLGQRFERARLEIGLAELNQIHTRAASC